MSETSQSNAFTIIRPSYKVSETTDKASTIHYANSPQGRARQSNQFVLVRVLQSLLVFLTYHAYSIFLFTCSDFKTIVIPSTVFGVSNSLAASAYGLENSPPVSLELLIDRTLQTFFWVILVFIPFSIDNQRTPSAIEEDTLNKPWRPMPQKRLTPRQARWLMTCFFALVQCHGISGRGLGHRQSTSLFLLGLWYNNFGGADNHPVVRNGINAAGYMCFISGALENALGQRLDFPLQNPIGQTDLKFRLEQWLLLIAGIILTTVHLQDLYDQRGDAVRQRRTMPLVIGDGAARWTIAIPMTVWAFVCPLFWKVRAELFVLSVGLAFTVVGRVLLRRDEKSDRSTFRVWNYWIATIYAMPLFSQVH
ncbi:hypothetical protein N7468_000019 [Penicillium chermesinum]|uniref:Uncharacterized protein n=1 Tax=Penicillium chermesinum TaxID=63820 RepID=A0A9W9TXZ0_9EURO|nr:uncharacterized protein N7468_000019 [Penicillium chermesinum]KAJ5248568.1 hypothetical protein N7468_000019 [Penicillium chermesinum]KAJ6150682.1 hypothetical protein N7470_007276 [Penicillium chermesinum]